MIVIGIMGVVLTMGVPIVYKALNKAPMSKAISDIVEVCSNARSLAIMQGKKVDVIFHPKEGRLEIGSAAVSTRTEGSPTPTPPVAMSAPSASGSGRSARLSEKILIEMLDINKQDHDFRDYDSAYVRFFPNGTCDELTIILVSDQNERREITLEISTGLASVESNPMRFR